jgi:hypothetical protein
MAEKHSRLTAGQRAAGTALALQLLMALVTTGLAAAYVVSEADWIPPLAGAALLATVIACVVAMFRVREESRERREAERSLSAIGRPEE